MKIKQFNFKSNKGFTLIELLAVMSIASILIGIVGFNFIRLQNTSSRRSSVNTLISDLKLQQVKAMSGSTEGRAVSDSYGIYFLADQYVLFHGSVYDEDDTANFPIVLPENIEIASTTLPDNTIVFANLSGEMNGFTDGNNTITVRELNSNTEQTVTINRYGVITSVN
jgi:prepilin-type N-terminal cleavage/methylation domain-containing protein